MEKSLFCFFKLNSDRWFLFVAAFCSQSNEVGPGVQNSSYAKLLALAWAL